MTNYTYDDFGKEYDIAGIVTGLNELTGGWLTGLLLIFLFFIIISVNYQNTRDLGASVVTSSFVVFIISSLMWSFGMIGLVYVIVPLTLLLMSVGMRFYGGR